MYNDKIEIESPYGHITISYGRHNKHRVRVLDIDGGMESATYIEEELQNELLFEYMYLFDLMFDENYLEDRQINDVLLIGGGAFHYPKYFPIALAITSTVAWISSLVLLWAPTSIKTILSLVP